MKIQEFCNMKKFEGIMSNWAKATGLATVAVGADGKYISACYNFTDFCIKLTRGCAEGRKRCEHCDATGNGVYECHAGLIDFGIPIMLNDGTVLGNIIGGQVLPEQPDENKFRETAQELGINPDQYIRALNKVTVKTRGEIESAANLLGDVINMFVQSSYIEYMNSNIIYELESGISKIVNDVANVTSETKNLNSFASKQKILALNASIEAARAGEHGKGFEVVAKEVQKLADNMRGTSENIDKYTDELIDITAKLANAFK